ncbi:hypothetical protein BD413DRAFT_701587 [Trametes elegans]|nr:hypothetical protein BD413DRAFT_701587 [Trametes elegans]
MTSRPDVERIYNSAARRLFNSDYAAASAIVHRALDGNSLDNPSRFTLYERSISAFLRHGEVMRAAMLYSRMIREGYIPSVSLRVQLHVVKLAELSVSEDALYEVIREAFSQESFDEAALRDLLRTLIQAIKASPQFVRRIMDGFISECPPDYTLSSETATYVIRMYQKAGAEEDAKYWISYSSKLPAPEERKSGIAVLAPYTTLLHDLAASRPSFSVYKWTLERLRAANVTPDLPFYNALLAHEIGRLNFAPAFALYRLLVERRSAVDPPTAQTFAPVFRAIRRLAGKGFQRMRGFHAALGMGAPSARSVHRDMLTCHVEATRPLSPNRPSAALEVAVLHKAIRTFLLLKDYAGACAAVRAFHFFPGAVGAPTIGTHRLVFGALLGHIRLGMREVAHRIAAGRDPADVWAYRFIGLQNVPASRLADVPLNMSMIHRVLRFGADPRVNLDFFPAPDYEQWTTDKTYGPLSSCEEDEGERWERLADPQDFHPYGLPTPLEFADLKPVPEGSTYDVEPLERALRRAIAASLPPSALPLATRVSEAIVRAEAEMVPKS